MSGNSNEQGPVVATAQARLPTRHGEFITHVYRSHDGTEHVAVVAGDVRGKENVLVRVHSECLTGDILGSMRCDCGEQLELALQTIAAAGEGVVIYLRGHEGRGIGLTHKMRAYELQDQGHDTVQANLALGMPVDARSYEVAAAMLEDLGVGSLRLLSNNPVKLTQLEEYGLKVTERVPVVATPNAENVRYLRTKQEKMGHWLEIGEQAPVETPSST